MKMSASASARGHTHTDKQRRLEGHHRNRQAAAAPLSRGRASLVKIGWPANNDAALVKMAAQCVANTKLYEEEAVYAPAFAGGSEAAMSTVCALGANSLR